MRPARSIALLPLLILLAAPARAADPRPTPALGTLPASDSLLEWEDASFRLVLGETVAAGPVGIALTAVTIGFAIDGLPNSAPPRSGIPLGIGACFGLGSMIVGLARLDNLRRYRAWKRDALADGSFDAAELRLIRRWQAKENRAVGLGMLIDALVNIALVIPWSLAGVENTAGEQFKQDVSVVLGVSVGINFGGGTAQIAMGQRELYWLRKDPVGF